MMLKKHGKLLLCALFFIAALAAAYFLFFAKRSSRTITVRYDTNFSPASENELSQLVIDAVKSGADADKVFSMAKSYIPAVKNVIINRLKPGYTRVFIKSEQPWMIVRCIPSHNFILTRNGAYTPLRHYSKEHVHGLANVIITCKKFSDDDRTQLYCWARQLPADFFSQYHVTWKKKTELVVRDKKNPRLRMIATVDTRFTPRVLRDLAAIQDKIRLKKGTKNWKADMRFRDQIVLAPIKKEKGTR